MKKSVRLAGLVVAGVAALSFSFAGTSYANDSVTNTTATVNQEQTSKSGDYQYVGSEWLDSKKLFVKDGEVYLRLAPEGAMDAPAPLLLPKHLGEKYLKNPKAFSGWIVHRYVKYLQFPNLQELRFDFHDSKNHYQGTATQPYWLP
ncbi:hypothetical protein [Thermoactinomyces sp. DSM 45892]|uniref:hypothetical protein n=1 Tax=Thermoactinomyces sp. DSM 45892 TaxID=1882753 RepID=UPI00089784DB|nr:hypothetical protein [Thermoactinomyces sp. DSM 45892]SDY01343.1 hypothetical protein SAMN05444416_101239 [Thermoactinomyces sp. DSM 45892]